ncbi:hypothetical protein P3T73_07760 [Kiritimatiellota bacterium B12222]|nr:hypothetical protein P3T73_07760 [Kiritimatiellota bacterium B12222]
MSHKIYLPRFFLRMTVGFVSVLFCALLLAGDAENVLSNPDLELSGDSAGLSSWRLSPKGVSVASESKGLPKEIEVAIEVQIGEVQKNDGALSQSVYRKKTDPDTWQLSGWFKSEENRAGYVQVKLYDGDSELERINVEYTPTKWEAFSKTFDASRATKIIVLCRWRNYEKYEGSKVWFGGLELKPVK